MADLDLIRDTVLAEAELRELDLGMDGSKWKHGYIPLNPVAVAIKEKRWHNTGHPSLGNRHRLAVSRAIRNARIKRKREALARKKAAAVPKPAPNLVHEAGRPKVERKPDHPYDASVGKIRRSTPEELAADKRRIAEVRRTMKPSGPSYDESKAKHWIPGHDRPVMITDRKDGKASFVAHDNTRGQVDEHRVETSQSAAEERARQEHADWVHEQEKKNTANANRERIQKAMEPQTRATSPAAANAKLRQAMHGSTASKKVNPDDLEKQVKIKRSLKKGDYVHVIGTTHDYGRDANGDFKRTERKTHSLMRVTGEDWHSGRVQLTDPTNPATKSREIAPGEKIGAVFAHERHNEASISRAGFVHFGNGKDVHDFMAKHSGPTPDRVIRVPHGLTVEKTPNKRKGDKGWQVTHDASGMRVGDTFASKTHAENHATALGTTGVDWQKGKDELIGARGELRQHEQIMRGHPGTVYASDLEGKDLSPGPEAIRKPVTAGRSTPKDIKPSEFLKPVKAPRKPTTKDTATMKKQRAELERRMSAPAEPYDRQRKYQPGEKVSYTLHRGKGQPSEQRTGEVWSADATGLHVTSTNPETGKVEMHRADPYSSDFRPVDTAGGRQMFEQMVQGRINDWKRSQVKRVKVGEKEVEHRTSMGRGFHKEPIYEDQPIQDTSTYSTGTRSASEHWKRVEAEMARRKRERAKAG